MRGTLFLPRQDRAICRFIPAHAGNAMPPKEPFSLAAVHPRACGERFNLGAGAFRLPGSSPRMRGTLWRQHPPPRAHRFIPAHAGNAKYRSRSPSPAPVHPRACGERGGDKLSSFVTLGSSPRMRGTLLHRLRHASKPRFIPAHAGNARRPTTPCWQPAVHPRACGERLMSSLASHNVTGSSPRMRGTHVLRGRFAVS